MDDWTPKPGELVERTDGTWHYIEWVDGNDPISKSDGCTCYNGKPLLPAATTPDEAYAAFFALNTDGSPHAIVTLEDGWLYMRSAQDVPTYQTSGRSYIAPQFLAAHNRDMQKFEAFCEWLKQVQG